MIGYDFAFFWQAAREVLSGRSPYDIGGFFSPHPLALLLVPLGLLPFLAAFAVWTALKLVLLRNSTDRWGFVKALLFFPVAYELQEGQLVLLVFLLALRSNWFGVVISTLRPQLAIWVIPWTAWEWIKAKRYDQFWKSALGIVVLYGASTLIEPGWWTEWLRAGGVAWQYNAQAASLFGLAQILPLPHLTVFIGIAVLAAAGFVLLRPRTRLAFWQWVALFNPVAHLYSLVVLFDQVDWVVIALAWLALPLTRLVHSNAVWALIPLYLILKPRLGPLGQNRRGAREAAEDRAA